MRTLSISPSLLEAWRVAKADLYPNALQSLIESLEGKRTPNAAMSRGTAWHKMLDKGPDMFWKFETGRYEVLEPEMNIRHVFSTEAVEPLRVVRSQIMNAAREVWHVATLGTVEGFNVIMNMRYDAILGLEVHEFKTKSSKPSYSDYFKSVQWKCYLNGIPEMQKVVYHVFQLNTTGTECNYTKMTMNRQDYDRAEIVELARGLIGWASQTGYIDRLAEKAKR